MGFLIPMILSFQRRILVSSVVARVVVSKRLRIFLMSRILSAGSPANIVFLNLIL